MGLLESTILRNTSRIGICALLLLGLSTAALADEHKQEKKSSPHKIMAPARAASNGQHAGGPAQAGHPGGPAMGGGAQAGRSSGPAMGGGAQAGRFNSGASRGQAMPKGASVGRTPSGANVMRRADGHVAMVHNERTGITVQRGLNGSRMVVAERPDHSRVVVTRPGFGYVQRPYTYRGHEFASRVYVRGGVTYNRVYGRYAWRGAYINPYFPGRYYRPAFYSWAYYPWAAPVSFGWGWGGAGWYAYYGPYFRPYPVYAAPAYWLTDYLIAESLQAAYAEQQADNSKVLNIPPEEAQQNATALTPETKELIAEEVKRQVALENAESTQVQQGSPDDASSSIQRMLTDGVAHVFVAGQYLDLVDSNGTECTLSDGDAVQLGQNDAGATDINVVVLASKGGRECGKGATVSVTLEELQEMQNHMREIIDRGMDELQKKQGTAGLPAAPKDAQAAPTDSPLATIAPPAPPADEVKNELTQEQKAADAEEQAASQASTTPQ
ncbi:MAG: hypothetical protein P4M01_01950 [Acidobacteriota bacterium]|nr:hypothetical protein [Acidobacteriota bacterium]